MELINAVRVVTSLHRLLSGLYDRPIEPGILVFVYLKFVLYFLQRPKICVLGGGFGGLYTALRLESLIWPPDKKPQVLTY